MISHANSRLAAKDRNWSQYPIGTKAHSCNGGYWLRVPDGWQWNGGTPFAGSTCAIPGGEAVGCCVELPNDVQTSATKDNTISIGKHYSIYSHRKGRFSGVVVAINDEFCDVEITKGKASAMLAENERQTGEVVSLRIKLCTFRELNHASTR